MRGDVEARYSAFAHALIANGHNATQAAITAGYTAEHAHVRGSELVRNRKVQEILKKIAAPVLEQMSLNSERTLQEIARGAYGNPGDLLSWSDKLRGLDMAMKYHGLYERDNAQRAPSLALQIVSVGNE